MPRPASLQPSWAALHGFASTGAAFGALQLPGRMWAPDLPGHDGRPWPAALQDFDRVTDHLIEEVKATLPRPRFLLGYSMGGRLGAVAWMRSPDLFEGAVLVGVHPGDLEERARRQRAALDRERARQLRADPEAFFRAWDSQPMFGQRPPKSRALNRAEGFATALETLSLAKMPNCRPFLDRRGAVILVGEGDERFRRLWGERARIVPGAHHDVVHDAPEAVGRAAACSWKSWRHAPDGP